MSSIRFLRTFVAAARGGSFAAAADQVALTQAAVGQQMRALEAEMKKTLFDKTGRTMVLSPAGHLLLPRAEELLAQYESMRRDLQDQRQIAGTIKLGSLISAMGLLSSTLAQLKSLHPNLEVELRVREQTQLMQDVVSGELDAAVVVERQWPGGAGPAVDAVLRRDAHRHRQLGHRRARHEHCEPVRQPALHPLRPAHTDRRAHRPHPAAAAAGAERVPGAQLAAGHCGARAQERGLHHGAAAENFDWESDPALCVLQLPGRPIARRLGMLENGRRSHITGVVREEMLAHLRRRSWAPDTHDRQG